MQAARNQTSEGWISQAIGTLTSMRLMNFIYLGLFVVFLTHCLLAFRLKKITQHLDSVKQHKITHHQHVPIKDTRDTQWIHQRMDHVQQRLDRLKDEALDFDQRISRLQGSSSSSNVQ